MVGFADREAPEPQSEDAMVQISDNAGNLIKKMTARHGFAWEPAPRDGDLVFEGLDGAKVFVDPKSHRLIDGTTLDYDTSLVSRGFIFNNPNAKSSCGCGASFST